MSILSFHQAEENDMIGSFHQVENQMIFRWLKPFSQATSLFSEQIVGWWSRQFRNSFWSKMMNASKRNIKTCFGIIQLDMRWNFLLFSNIWSSLMDKLKISIYCLFFSDRKIIKGRCSFWCVFMHIDFLIYLWICIIGLF